MDGASVEPSGPQHCQPTNSPKGQTPNACDWRMFRRELFRPPEPMEEEHEEEPGDSALREREELTTS
jgi:hypothetical protein